MFKILCLIIFLFTFMSGDELTTVTLQLAHKYRFQSAGYIIAKEKGFYLKRGLDVDLREYDQNISIEDEVLKGGAQFGIGEDTLIVDRITKDKPFLLLFALCQKDSDLLKNIDNNSSTNIDLNHLTTKNVYDDILFTTENYFDDNMQTVDTFYKASVLGWNYAFSHIDETIDIIQDKYNTLNLTKESLEKEAKMLKKLAFEQQVKLGNINPKKIKNFARDLKLENTAQGYSRDYSSFIYELPQKGKIRFSPAEKRYIQAHSTIKIGVLANFYPFDTLNLQGKHVGLFHDILNIISKYTKLNMEFEYFKDIPTLTKGLEKKDTDIIGIIPKISGADISYTPSFAKVHEYLFINDKNRKKELKNIGILGFDPQKINNKKRLIKTLYRKVNVKIYDDLDSAIRQLQNKKIDALYAPEFSMLHKINRSHLKYIDFSYPKQSLPEEYLFAGTSSSNDILKQIVSKALNEITLEQSYELQTKWTPPPIVKDKTNWKQIVQIIIIIAIIIIMIIYKQISMSQANKKLKIQEKKLLKTQQILLEQVQKDPLTKLYNRRYFADVSKDILSIAKRERYPICVIMADIDNFKTINDTYGHLAGDIVLKEISKRLKQISRKSDIIARYGGEEFIILIPNAELNGSQQFAEKIRATIAYPPFKIDDKTSINVTISLGLTHLHIKEDSTIEDIFVRADKALYEAKNSGKNRVFVIL